MITYYTGQFRQVAEVFDDAIHVTAAEAYSPEEQEAWSPRPIDYEHWQWRCEFKRPFLFQIDGRVVGFLELDSDGHIDCHYVHSEFSRQGIGGQLLQHAINIGIKRELPKLYVEASHIARGLYEQYGFEMTRANQVERNGITLENWIMERQLNR